MKRLLSAACLVLCAAAPALAGTIPNPAPEPVLIGGFWYVLINGVFTLLG